MSTSIPTRPHEGVAHYLHHSIMNATKLGRVLDHRDISSMMQRGRVGTQNHDEVADALQELADTCEIARDGGEAAWRLLRPCTCNHAVKKWGDLLAQPKNKQDSVDFHASGVIVFGQPSISLTSSSGDVASDRVNGEVCQLPGSRIRRKAGAPRHPDSPWGLCHYFHDALVNAGVGGWIATAPKSLLKGFSEMKKAGTSPVEIRKMIDIFAMHPEQIRNSKVLPAQLFLYRRRHLETRAALAVQHAGPIDWTGSATSEVVVAKNWTGL